MMTVKTLGVLSLWDRIISGRILSFMKEILALPRDLQDVRWP